MTAYGARRDRITSGAVVSSMVGAACSYNFSMERGASLTTEIIPLESRIRGYFQGALIDCIK
jgi:hypothetical protein